MMPPAAAAVKAPATGMCFAMVRRDALEGSGGCPPGAAPIAGIEVNR